MVRLHSATPVKLFRILCLCCIALVLIGASLSYASSKKKSPPPAPVITDSMTPGQVDKAMAEMDDEQARTLLHKRLTEQAQAREAQSASKTRTSLLMDASTSVRERLLALKASRGNILDELGDSLHTMAKGEGAGALLYACLIALLIAFVAWALETMFRRRVTGLRSRTGSDLESQPKSRILAVDLFIAVSGLLLYGAVVLALFSVFFGKETPGYVAAAHILLFFLVYRPIQVVTRLLLRPKTPDLRPIHVSNTAAANLNNFIGMIMLLSIGGKFILDAFQAVNTPEPAVISLQLAIACLVFLFMIAAILYFREDVAKAIAERPDSQGLSARYKSQFASRWHIFALLYISLVAVLYVAVLLINGPDGPQGMFLISLGVIPFYYFLDWIARRILDGVFGILVARPPKPISMVRGDMEDGGAGHSAPAEAEAEQAEGEATQPVLVEPPRPSSHPYYEVTRRITRLLLVGFVLLILLWAWHVPVPRAGLIIESGINILVILFLAVGLWSLIKRGIERKLREGPEESASSPRLRTLLPLFQKVLGVFFLVTAALMVISQFGVNIGPLLAGAGVFGLAIGLGSQTLVKDVVAGVFFLMDDAFRVGDYVQMGKTEGYVVRMSVRTILLEHYLGYVLIIPYGDIKNVVNFSRNPISIKIKFPMPLETDPKVFKKIVRKINEQLMNDEEFKDDLVQPIKSQGVKKIQDSTMIFGVKFMAKPGTQFSIRKEVYARLYKELKKAGLTFAAPGVTVYTANLAAEDAEAARQGAAAAAAQQRKKSEDGGEE